MIAGWLLELALCSLLLGGIVWSTRSRHLAILTFCSFGVRLILGETLFLISAFQLPVLKEQQLAGGFWSFGSDGLLFHNQALTVLSASFSPFAAIRDAIFSSAESFGFDHGTALTSFPRILAVAYVLFGASPSQGLLIVAVAAAACVPLAYLGAKAAGLSVKQSTIVSVLVTCWPSTFIWSGQLLKDSLQWVGLLAVASGFLILFKRRNNGGVVLVLAAGLVLFGEFLSAAVRGYATALLTCSIIACLVVVLVRRGSRRARLTTAAFVLGMAAVGSVPALRSLRQSPLPGINKPSPSLAIEVPSRAKSANRLTVNSATILTVGWQGVTADGWDWIGLYPAGEPTDYLSFAFVNCSQQATVGTPSGSCQFRMPVSPGAYEFRLEDVNHNLLAAAGPVQVMSSGLTPVPSRPTDVAIQGLGTPMTPREPTTEPKTTRATPVVVPTSTPVPKPTQAGSEPTQPCVLLTPLLTAREGFMTAGGSSQLDSNVHLASCLSILAYVPRAAELTFIAPLPNDWYRFGQTIGPLRYLLPLETVLLWAFSLGFAVGFAKAWYQPTSGTLAIGMYCLLLGIALGLVVTNFGTLFRLRLAVILPGAILAVEGWSLILEAAQRFGPRRRLSIERSTSAAEDTRRGHAVGTS